MKASLIFFFVGLYSIAFSQNVKSISVDNLGGIYHITATDTLFKFSPNTPVDYNYSNKTLGAIGAINTQNPLKILVGHPGLSTIVVLDVTLRETSRIFLPDLNIFSDSTAFCLTPDNNIYLYDDFEQQVVTVTETGQEIQRSPTLLQEVGYIPQVQSMVFENNVLYLNDPRYGLLMLDQFGKYLRTLPLKGLNAFQVIGNRVYYVENGQLISYNNRYFDKQVILDLPEATQQINIADKKVYALRQGTVLEISPQKP